MDTPHLQRWARGYLGAEMRSLPKPSATVPAERRASMTWVQRLKRVFNLDIETCPACGGVLRIIADIEDPVVIEKILTRLDKRAASAAPPRLPPCRAPQQTRLFD